MVRITGNLQPASQPARMMASVFGGTKLTPVLRTPEANPFADTEPMGKYRRSARAGWLYPTTHCAQHSSSKSAEMWCDAICSRIGGGI